MSKDNKIASRSSRKASQWRAVRGGVTSPQGFMAAGIACGIKKKGLDLAVIFSSCPAEGAAVFTKNQVQAAPVLLSRKHLRAGNGQVRAIVINSGCANACTGRKGMQDALLSAQGVASHFGIEPAQVLVASTGVIGSLLPMPVVLKGISTAVSGLSSRGGEAAARAIMTTDTREKYCAFESIIEGKRVRIGGMAKGSGMIHPDMATMLAFITSDARLAGPRLNRIFRRVIDRTFNCLSVDGDTSTNDMVAVLANGMSGARIEGRLAAHFEAGLERVCESLVRSIATDGEGATKLVEVEVTGARSFEDARRIGKCIANSPLVKTACYGEEANWGRILCAAGYSGVSFDPDSTQLSIGGVVVFRKGVPQPSSLSAAERALSRKSVKIRLDMGQGRHEARIWTCDLTHGYIDINASYIS